MVLYRGQEVFNVAVMGYRNSLVYVQRMIDKILRKQRGFSRAYVDDRVIFSKTQDESWYHRLEKLPAGFRNTGVSLSFSNGPA